RDERGRQSAHDDRDPEDAPHLQSPFVRRPTEVPSSAIARSYAGRRYARCITKPSAQSSRSSRLTLHSAKPVHASTFHVKGGRGGHIGRGTRCTACAITAAVVSALRRQWLLGPRQGELDVAVDVHREALAGVRLVH